MHNNEDNESEGVQEQESQNDPVANAFEVLCVHSDIQHGGAPFDRGRGGAAEVGWPVGATRLVAERIILERESLQLEKEHGLEDVGCACQSESHAQDQYHNLETLWAGWHSGL